MDEDAPQADRHEPPVKRDESFFRSLFERARDALFVQDVSSGTILEVNDAACDLFGRTREELVGQLRASLFPPESALIYEAAHEDQIHRYNAIPSPVLLTRTDGSKIRGEMSAVVVDDLGVVVLQVVFRGITQRRREVEERVREAAHTREHQKLEAVAVLAGGVAHEMNNVLAGILTTATLLVRSLPPGPGHADAAAIVQAVRRGKALTHNILGFAQRGMYRREVVAVDRLLAEVTALCRRSFPDDVVVETDFRSTRNFKGDPEQVAEALMNGCLNAVESMDGKGGTLTITSADVDLGPDDLVGVADASPGPFVRIVVRDTGQGMDAETLARAFDPFFTTKEWGVSGGLGLSMVYGVVQHHHGHVRLQSEPGVGTVLTIELPEALEPFAVPTTQPAPRPTDRAGAVLVVDDDDWVRFSSRRLLEGMGRTVLEARDGVEALEVYQQHADELAFVLLDLRMPRMDGAEALRQLMRINPDARVILCTGFDREHISQDLFTLGHVGFLRKPFEAVELTGQMDAVWPEVAAEAPSPETAPAG